MRTPALGAILFSTLLVLSAPADDKPAPPAKPPAKAKAGDIPGYEVRKIQGFKVAISQKVLEQPTDEFPVKPLDVLEGELKDLGRVLPAKWLAELHKVPVWVEWDEGEDERGGRVIAQYLGGPFLAYALQGPNSALRGNTIEILTLRRLTEIKLRDRNAQKQIVLLHELIHAIHDKIIGFNNQAIRDAYRQAMDRKLYDKVLHVSGQMRRAYAATNEAEYFAEISCAYLDRCNYFPFTREDLKGHDPVGYKLMEQIWGKPEAIARQIAPEKKSAPPSTGSGKESPKPAPSADAKAIDPAKAAAAKLDLIRSLIKDGKAEKARERLRELMQSYPDTPAAGEAKQLLDALKG
jgi:hypothetical protein